MNSTDTSDTRTDAELVDSALSGDRAAYGELVCRYGKCVVATALRTMCDFHSAQDVAQEVFLTAYRKLGRLRDGSMFGPWVLKITRRHACKSNKRRARVAQRDASNISRSQSDHDRLADDQSELLAAVNRLPEHERIVVILHYFQEQSVQTVARMTGRPIGTVTKQLSRAVKRLKIFLLKTTSQKEPLA
jgi:RNA polymerase sigma-70 factor, ECF subfamily